MEDKLKPEVTDAPETITKEEQLSRAHSVAIRVRLVNRARAAVVRSQVVSAYEIIDNIRLTPGLSDTVFRDKIIGVKKNLEMALSDFLLSDTYHEEALNKIYKMSDKEYEESLHSPDAEGTDSPVKVRY